MVVSYPCKFSEQLLFSFQLEKTLDSFQVHLLKTESRYVLSFLNISTPNKNCGQQLLPESYVIGNIQKATIIEPDVREQIQQLVGACPLEAPTFKRVYTIKELCIIH